MLYDPQKQRPSRLITRRPHSDSGLNVSRRLEVWMSHHSYLLWYLHSPLSSVVLKFGYTLESPRELKKKKKTVLMSGSCPQTFCKTWSREIFLKIRSQTSCFNLIQEHVRTENPSFHHRPTESETLWDGPSNLLQQAQQMFLVNVLVGEALVGLGWGLGIQMFHELLRWF